MRLRVSFHRSRRSPEVRPGQGRPSRAVYLFWGVGGAYLLLALLFYAPHLLGRRRFPDGDLTYHFVPFALYLTDRLRNGHLPLWNPYTFAGHPFLADVQAAVFYVPTTVLWLLTAAWNTPGVRAYLFQVDAAVHLALAGWGVYALARALTGQHVAAFLAGVTFAFSGFLTGYPPLQPAVLHTAVWAPWALWGLYRGWRGQRGGWPVTTGALSLALFAGHPQTFLMIAYLVVAWAIFLAAQGPTFRDARRFSLRAVAAGGLAAGLTAVQWWPSLEFTRLSVRAHLSYAEAGRGFPLQDTWQLLFPDVLTLYSPLYVGVVPLLLAVWAVYRRGAAASSPGVRRMVVFWAGVALLFLGISYGRHGVLFPLFYRWVPGWSLFRGQERAAFVVTLALSLLAGFGVALLDRTRRPFARRWVAAVVVGVGVAASVFAGGWVQPGQAAVDGPAFARIAVRTLLWAALGSGAMVGLRRRPRALVLLLLILADLWVVNRPRNSVPGPAWAHTLTPPEVLAVRDAVRQEATTGLPGRVFNEYRVYENYGMVVGVEDLGGSSPLRLARYARLFSDFPLHRLWRLWGVRYVLTWRAEMFMPAERLAVFPHGPDEGPTYLYRLKNVFPRAWVVGRLRVADDEAAWRWLADFASDVDGEAVVPPAARAVLGAAWPTGERVTAVVRVERLTPEHVRVHGRSDRPGLLVVAENWMPGWQATLRYPDGTVSSAPVVRADLTLIGVPVPAGTWAVDLRYRPLSVRVGLAVSLLSLGLALLLGPGKALVRQRRRNRGRRDRAQGA